MGPLYKIYGEAVVLNQGRSLSHKVSTFIIVGKNSYLELVFKTLLLTNKRLSVIPLIIISLQLMEKFE